MQSGFTAWIYYSSTQFFFRLSFRFKAHNDAKSTTENERKRERKKRNMATNTTQEQNTRRRKKSKQFDAHII